MNLLEAYRYLVALEQHRHFGRAALACHITQPALSNALRALETHLDVAIVRRGRLYEGLTPEGERVLAAAHRMLREQEVLTQELRGSEAQPEGRLVIGAVPTAVPVAARFAAALTRRAPKLQVVVRSLASQEIEAGLDNLALDLGLGYGDRLAGRKGASLHVVPQYDEHYYLVCGATPADTAGPFGPPMSWAEASGARLCLLGAEMHNRVILDKAFCEAGAVASPVIETNSVLALLVSVQQGGVSAVLPGALVAVAVKVGGVTVRALTSPQVRTPIAFMSSAQARPSRALQAALVWASDARWQAELALHSGALAERA